MATDWTDMFDITKVSEDPADWGEFDVPLPYLSPNTEESCPDSLDEVMDYVRCECADTDRATPDRLQFIRTAQVNDSKYWIWRYTEEDGSECFVTSSIDATGSGSLGLSDVFASPARDRPLTPEQFLIADYHNLVYW